MKCIFTEWSSITLSINTSVCQYTPLDFKILSGEWSSFSASQQFCQLFCYRMLMAVLPKALHLCLSLTDESIHSLVSYCLRYI